MNRQETIDLLARIEKLEKSYRRLYDAVFGDYSHEGPPLVERIMDFARSREPIPAPIETPFLASLTPDEMTARISEPNRLKRGPGRRRKDASAT